MQILVAVEHLGGRRYRARSGEPLALTAEGASRIEAVQNLRQLILEKLRSGVVLTHIDVPVNDNPLILYAGMYDENDPEIQAWEQAMKDYRRQVEEDPNY